MDDAAWLRKALLQQCPACHWLVDARGVFRSIYGDPSSLFGKPAAKLAGRPVATALSRDRAKVWSSRFARVFAGENLTLHQRDGGAAWYISLFAIRRRGQILYAGGLAREVTPEGAAEMELRHTVLGALKAQESERRAASKFLHDSVGQNLTALGLQLDLVRMDLAAGDPEPRARLGEIQQLLETMMEQVREYSYELNPSIVERVGLRPALDRLASRVRPQFAGTVRLQADPVLKVEPRIATALYHIAQEAVDNAVQHAGCSGIEIAIKSRRDRPILEVRDDGRGFDPDDVMGAGRGLGLLSMEHYAAEAGLELSISTPRQGGTLVRAIARAGS